MPAARTDRALASLVLAILACVALIGFAQGLRSALAGPRMLPGETAAAAAPTGAAPRDAAAGLPLDEARVHEIAREEADAALARIHPSPRRVRPADTPDEDADPADAAAPMSATPTAPPAATPPAAPQDQPSNPDVH